MSQPFQHVEARSRRSNEWRRAHGLRRLLLAAMASCVVGCAAMPQPMLRVDAKEFRSQVHTICLYKAQFELLPPAPEKSAQELEVMLETTLTNGGIRVVRSVAFDGIWQEVVIEAGGLYDPNTGRVASERRVELHQTYRTRLAEQHGCDAFLEPYVRVVTASFDSGRLAWDGVSQPMPWSYAGYLPALSLHVRVIDHDGRELYFGTGGIQALSRLDVGFWAAEFKPQPQADVLAYPDLNLRGVRASLSGMVTLVDDASDSVNQPKLPSER